MKEAAAAVVGIVGGELFAGGDTALLLGRCSGVGGDLGESLGALIGKVSHYATLVASDGGLVLGGDRDSIAPSPWSSVGVVVVAGGSHRGTVEVIVVVVASWPWVSSTPIGETRT